jgi:hypothetical protein
MKTLRQIALTLIFLVSIPTVNFGQIAPDLKSAADFAILAATGISFAPPQSTISNLDVGLHPGFRSSITGDVANLLLINGVILAADEDPTNRLPQAKLDLLNAYLFAELASLPAPATIAGNQGGSTLAPGIYKSTSTLSIEGSDLTLNAGGDENAVWIFQIASTLTTTVGGNIVLAGGAKANNVYWQVGSSATLGSGTDFKGNILALVSITMNSGATIDGRLLARNGAVTFAGNNVMNKPEESQQPASGELNITKTANPQTFTAVGDAISYDIVVENTGTDPLTFDVEDNLTGNTWLNEMLGGGQSNTFTTDPYIITENDFLAGFVANIATAETDEDLVSTYAIVLKEGLIISKVATPKTYAFPGQQIDYEIIVENTGTATMTFDVEDDLTGDTWTNQTLGPLQSLILQTSYEIVQADINNGTVENTAIATVSNVMAASDSEIVILEGLLAVPMSAWAILVLIGLIGIFIFIRYRVM